MDIEPGKFYRLKIDSRFKVKVVSVSGRKVVYSRAGSLLPISKPVPYFRANFEKCP